MTQNAPRMMPDVTVLLRGNLQGEAEIEGGGRIAITETVERTLTVSLTLPDLPPPPSPPPARPATAADMASAMGGPGLNIGDTFEVAGATLEAGDMAEIRARGFRHVRIPAACQDHEDDEPWLRRLDAAINQALAAGHVVTIDPLHHFRGLMVDPAAHRPKALRVTGKLARRWAALPQNLVAWELLNEAKGKMVGPTLNAFLRDTAKEVRDVTPNRVLIVGDAMDSATPGWSGSFDPPVDERVMMKIHSYDSGTANNDDIDFTHQGEEFVDRGHLRDVQWSGNPTQTTFLRSHFDAAANFAARKGIKAIVVNEWGCVRRAPKADYERFLRWHREEFARRGWPWNYWNFATNNFGLKPRGQAWNAGALQALGLA